MLDLLRMLFGASIRVAAALAALALIARFGHSPAALQTAPLVQIVGVVDRIERGRIITIVVTAVALVNEVNHYVSHRERQFLEVVFHLGEQR